MSTLILPGSPEFQETTKVVNLASRRAPRAPEPASLVGRTLMLNLTKARGFFCGGFQLSMHVPFAIVTEQAQLEPIKKALADGRLVDITGQDPKTGFKGTGGQASKVEVEDTDQQAFVTKKDGQVVVVIPKNKREAAKYAREIEKTGAITITDRMAVDQATTGLSDITVTDLPTPLKRPQSRPRRKRR